LLAEFFLLLNLFGDILLVLFLNKFCKESNLSFFYRFEGSKTSFKLIKSLKKEIINDIRDYDINEIDGIRIENKNSWALIRASNTQPALTLRFESNSIENLNSIKEFLSTKLNNLTGEKWKF